MDGWKEEQGQGTYEFLGDHASHGNSYDVEFSLIGPAEMVNDFNEIFGHSIGGVSCQRFV